MKIYIKTKRCIAADGYSSVYFVGNTVEIEKLYESFVHKHTEIKPAYAASPGFTSWNQAYALEIRDDNTMFVIDSDTFLMMIINDSVKIVGAGSK